MQKLIKKKVMTLDVDAFVADIARPSEIPEAKQESKKRKAEKSDDPPSVADPAPSWTKLQQRDESTGEQVDLPSASNDRQWHKKLGHPTADLVTIAKGWATTSIALVGQQCPTFEFKDFLVVRRGAMTEVWTKRSFKKHEIMLAPVGSSVKDAYWTRGGPSCWKIAAEYTMCAKCKSTTFPTFCAISLAQKVDE